MHLMSRSLQPAAQHVAVVMQELKPRYRMHVMYSSQSRLAGKACKKMNEKSEGAGRCALRCRKVKTHVFCAGCSLLSTCSTSEYPGSLHQILQTIADCRHGVCSGVVMQVQGV